MAPVYLALGDSMSIDTYTDVVGGGAVSQFYRTLGSDWTLRDRSFDGCRMREVPTQEKGEVVTVTAGGNDLVERLGWLRQIGSTPIPATQATYLPRQIAEIAAEHKVLLESIRAANPRSVIIVGTIYEPASGLAANLNAALDAINAEIARNVSLIGGVTADIRSAFRGSS